MVICLGYSWLNIDTGEKVGCPNGCGLLVILKKRIPIQNLFNEEVFDAVLMDPELNQAEAAAFGYLAALCPECGFAATTEEPHSPNKKRENTEAFMKSTFPNEVRRPTE